MTITKTSVTLPTSTSINLQSFVPNPFYSDPSCTITTMPFEVPDYIVKNPKHKYSITPWKIADSKCG